VQSQSARPVRSFASVYNPRRNNFDALRVGLATLVVWSHCYPLSGREKDWFTILSGQVDGGSLAVDGFFLLSGFLVSQSWFAAPDVGVFAKKRLLRIIPALVFATMFGALIIGPFVTSDGPLTYLATSGPWLHFLGVPLNRYLFIPGTFPSNPLPEMMNSPLWSLRYELICYGIVAAIGVLAQRRWEVVVLALFLASSALSASDLPLGRVGESLARLASCFTAGMLFYRFRDRVPYSAGVGAAVATVLVAAFFTAGFRVAFPLLGGYLLLFIAFTKELPLAGFARHGDFSYGLYVLAYPIQQLLVHALGPEISIPMFFVATLIPTLALAAFSWHFIEAPALALKPRPSHQAPQ
jgi:peptidoglycan/LPS O-acetylase OafA/YrhL